MRIKKPGYKIYEIVLFLVYKSIFDLSYLFLIAPNWSYIGDKVDFNLSKYIIGWTIYVGLILLVEKIFRAGAYGLVVKLFIIFSITSSISLYGLKNIPSHGFYLLLIYWFIFIFTLRLLSRIDLGEGTRNSKKALSSKISIGEILIIVFSSVFVLFASWKYADFRILTDLFSSHLFRTVSNTYQHSVYGYMIGWVALVILPYLAFKSLSRRNYVLLLFLFVLELLLFSIASGKIYVLSFILTILVFYIFKRRNWETIITFTLSGFILLTVFSGVYYFYSDSSLFSFLIYRANGLPSAISYYYYDFFSQNEFLYLRESIARHFFDSPYSITFSRIIGYYYGLGGNYNNNMNNGLFGDAYSNFGVIGIILYPMVIALIFRLFVEFGKNVDQRLLVIALFIVINISTNSSLFTWLLSGGVLIFTVLFIADGVLFHNRIPFRTRLK